MKNSNRFGFVFKAQGLGHLGECQVETRRLASDEVMVILDASSRTGREPVSKSLESIATQFYRKHLRKNRPEQIQWVLHSPGASSTEGVYQKVQLQWDGERFCSPLHLIRLNQGAFNEAFGELH